MALQKFAMNPIEIGLRIVIELKKDVQAQGILHFLLKSTDLQVSYNFNMIAIHNRRPMMMTLPLMLDAYIDHQKETCDVVQPLI